MFEQLVRPFTSRQVTTTRRVVPVKTEDKPEVARIAWGAAGRLAQGVVQPKGVNLENIESVGWNIRGSIDKFHQSPNRAEREEVELPIKDGAGNTVGTAKISRAKEITWDTKNKPYLPNFGPDPQRQFGYNPNFPDAGKPFTYGAVLSPHVISVSTGAPPPAGLRSSVPSADISQRTDTYIYPE